jgi:hypothetical protein
VVHASLNSCTGALGCWAYNAWRQESACKRTAVGARAAGLGHAHAGCIDFWWYHGLIADEMRDGLKASCNMSTVGPLVKTGKYGVPHTSSECDELLDEVSSR